MCHCSKFFGCNASTLLAAPAFERNLQNGTGRISTSDLEEGLRQLNVFDGMSREQAFLATKRFDQNGDGTISLPEFLAFVGKPYAANDRPLEAKLRRVLLKAESVRTIYTDTRKKWWNSHTLHSSRRVGWGQLRLAQTHLLTYPCIRPSTLRHRGRDVVLK